MGKLKTYRIIVLGTSGSGKTVFLASMFDKLSVLRSEIGFFLQVPTKREQRILINAYRKIIDPRADWPAGTRDVSEWKFDCIVQANGQHYPVFQFVYLDYAGGAVTNSSSPFDIDEQTQAADAILVLLDGHKILYALEKMLHPSGHSLDYDLSHLLTILQGAGFKTVHFVITKWDLLEAKNYSLRQVRQHLLSNDKFEAIVQQRLALESPTRLIPISSVGKEFAKLNGKHMMEKLPDAQAKPFQVEVPLACVLIDGFQAERKRIEQNKRSLLFNPKLMFMQLLQAFGFLSGSALLFLPQFQLGSPVAGMIISFLDKPLENSIAKLRREQQASLRAIEDVDKAMISTILSYQVLVRKLESDFPESNLSRV